MDSNQPAKDESPYRSMLQSEPGLSWFPSRWGMLLAAGLIAAAGLAAYANSFSGPFIYDDISSISNNPTIRHLSEIGQVLSPPRDGETVSGRPLLNLSFAIDYAIGGASTRGYHATNLAIHILNGLLLLGVLRRTLCLPVLRSRFGHVALGLALAISLLWMLHPLQTESVTYIVQRAESLAALCYLMVLYAVVRGIQSKQPLFWYVLAVGACLSGVAVKETVVTAPLIVLLYDRTFVSGTFRESLRCRWGLYLGLIASWALLAGLVWSTGILGRRQELGAIEGWSYIRSQPGVILYYLRLSLWPHPLCLSYDWPVAQTLSAIWVPMLGLAVLLTLTVWGLIRRWAVAWLGAWFFLLLAPTSGIVPLNQLVFEHRMYLPLAAVMTLVVAVAYDGIQHWMPHRPMVRRACLVGGIGLVMLAGVVLGLLTFRRNDAYRSDLSIWQDTATKAPNSAVAHNNLGISLTSIGHLPEAVEHYQQAIRLKPDDAAIHINLCDAMGRLDRLPEAIEHGEQAIRLNSHSANAHNNLGLMLASSGQWMKAVEHFQEAIRLKPDYAQAHSNLGNTLAGHGRVTEAIDHCRRAVQLDPEDPKAHNNLGSVLAIAGRLPEAIEHYQEAVRLRPDDAVAHSNLGSILDKADRLPEALEHHQLAIRLQPNDPVAHSNLGDTFARAGRLAEAIEHFQWTVSITPDDGDAHNNLGLVLARLDRIPEALEQFQEAARLKPDFLQAQQNVVLALSRVGRIREAVQHGLDAAQRSPDQPQINRFVAWLMATHESADGGDPARAVELAQRACDLTNRQGVTCLDTLAAAYASAGRFDEAAATAKEAWQLAQAAGQGSLAEEIHIRLQLYRDRKPYREPSGHAAKGRL